VTLALAPHIIEHHLNHGTIIQFSIRDDHHQTRVMDFSSINQKQVIRVNVASVLVVVVLDGTLPAMLI
jgi:hypothetical protein